MKPQRNATATDELAPHAARSGCAGPSAWATVAVLAIAIGATYYPALAVPFVFDDVGITTNESIVSLWPLVGSMNQRGPLNPRADLPTSGRPLANLSFALNYAIGGGNPAGYHAVNLAMHFATALLLWAIVRCTLRLQYFAGQYDASAGWLALAVSLLWALHPLQTEAVVYIVQRTELMVALFYLATVYFSLRYWYLAPLSSPKDGIASTTAAANTGFYRVLWVTLAFLSSLCGMASKEVMVSAPLMVLLFERTFIAGSLAGALRRSWPLYVALASTWLLLIWLNIHSPRGISAGFGIGAPLILWWMTQAKMLLIYLKLAIWPSPLLIHYQLPYVETIGNVLTYVVPVVLLGATTIVMLWRNKPVGYLGCWIFAILAPTSVVPIVTEMAAERRMYLPLAAIIVLIIVGGYTLIQSALKPATRDARSSTVVAAVLIILIALMFGFVSANRLTDYNDELGMWSAVALHQPGNDMAHAARSGLLASAGRRAEAEEAIHAAVALKPKSAVALNNLGLSVKKMGDAENAAGQFKAALELQPEYVVAHVNLALTLADLQRFPEALEHFQQALRLQPDDASIHNGLATVLGRAGRRAEAIEEFQTAIALKPGDPAYRNNLAGTFIQMGRLPEAIEQCQLALRSRPDFFDAHYNLGAALLNANQFDEAIAELREALKLKPDDPAALNTLGAVFLQVGLYPQAIEHIRHAVKVQPDFALAHNNPGEALARADQLPEAIEHFRNAAKQDEHFAGAQVSWALALAAQGNHEEAVEHFEKAIELGADQPEMRNSLGDAYRKSGKPNCAIEQYRIAVKMNPNYMPGYANLVQTLALLG